MTGVQTCVFRSVDRGLLPKGHAWDEDLQQAVPIGMAVIAEQLERPLDLQQNLDTFKTNRATLLRFVGHYLREAEYDEKKLPVPGKMGDYYVVPGAKTKALTKLGGENLGQLYRYAKGDTEIVSVTESKEYVSAQVKVILIDQYRRPVGSAVAACSTAESGFRSERAQKKYGGDYRAALNDVIARAGKRAFVQAMIVATGSDEVFTNAEAVTPYDEAAVVDGEVVVETTVDRVPDEDEPTSTTPWPNEDKLKGKTLAQWSERALLWLLEPGRKVGEHTETWQALAKDELKRRSEK